MTPDVARMRSAAGEGYATATDLADWLVRRLGMPFREAHHVTGRIVAAAAAKSSRCTSCRLPPCRRSSRASAKDVFEVLSVESSVSSRAQLWRHGAEKCAPGGQPVAQGAGQGPPLNRESAVVTAWPCCRLLLAICYAGGVQECPTLTRSADRGYAGLPLSACSCMPRLACRLWAQGRARSAARRRRWLPTRGRRAGAVRLTDGNAATPAWAARRTRRLADRLSATDCHASFRLSQRRAARRGGRSRRRSRRRSGRRSTAIRPRRSSGITRCSPRPSPA